MPKDTDSSKSTQTQFPTAPHTHLTIQPHTKKQKITHPSSSPYRHLEGSLTVEDAGNCGSVHAKAQGGHGHGIFTPVIHHTTLETQSWLRQILTPTLRVTGRPTQTVRSPGQGRPLDNTPRLLRAEPSASTFTLGQLILAYSPQTPMSSPQGNFPPSLVETRQAKVEV